MSSIDLSLIDWSRAQFALTAMFHWIFVPLTIGLALIMAIMETIYYKTGKESWKQLTKFWMTLFGINFAIGIATGLILEFQFGTNWSNYSWFVGDIFGAPLAIEGIMSFFLEATFVAVMFFGWNKVSRGFHLTSTWLVCFAVCTSALWILVANAWMQYPTGMHFNPDMYRNEMANFWDVLLSPIAINKFTHTTLSAFVLGASFVVGVASWFLYKNKHIQFAKRSILIASIVGLASIILTIWTGHGSARQVTERQPMKMAAMEGLYHGLEHAPLVLIGVLNPAKQAYNDGVDPFLFKIEMPGLLSWLGTGNSSNFVAGISDIMDGHNKLVSYNGEVMQGMPSVAQRMASGTIARNALNNYRESSLAGNHMEAQGHLTLLEENYYNFGYGYFTSAEQAIPHVGLTFYSFHIMIIVGFYLLLFFAVMLWLAYKGKLANGKRWLYWVTILTIPLTYVASQAGWVVAEVGRQPWVIQDIMPTYAAISSVDVTSVQLSFFMFLTVFSVLLVAELRIMVRQIKSGPTEVPGDK